ncbi:putative disease resistance protein RGA1 [Silene latifolia]|uniref:putative disease resistance protein RGA1 n=1 Tax=Silene latifolia TaxID=37657 RepID=UPI003D76D763
MADIGISLAGKLIEVVGSEVIREVCSIWGYKSELDDLKGTITTIRKVLLDAESKDQLSHKAQDYVQKLQDAVYDADDLFDEFLTLAKLKQHTKDGKLSEKVRDFFSSKKNTVSVAFSMSRGVKKIRKKLDSIASNHNTFGFSVDSQPIRERREETCSYVFSDEVVGRECDLNKVVDMLLDSGSQDRVSFLSLVGVGGLGKTTLAQLVFNDERVKNEFPLRLWTCVSDESADEFDVKTILARILESASDDKHDGFTMDLVQRKLLGFLGGRKYLIVLDDVWNEDREKWLGLRKFLMGGGAGSRIIVTTRSERTAVVVDEEHIYELKGLSPENSWHLFEMTAFGENRRQGVNSSELVELGKKIVEQCSNVPLAIKVVGTLLYGQNESKWRLFQECGLAKLNNGDNKIMSILKLSYDNLESPLKTCFSYCALFPKDFRINKEKLIRLWMAQGYIVPLDVGQSLEDAGEEYVSILLRRCFFQDVEKNEFGGVKSFKIHDLIHDVAQKVGGKGVVGVSSIQRNLGDEAHHLFHIGSKCKESIFSKCKIRSYVRDGFEINFPVAKLVENWNFLRTLDLHDLDLVTLPNSIGKLLHLRYLDLSYNRHLQEVPDSVTKLYNLQTLDLRECSDLDELPKDLAKLANLRHLDLDGCRGLSCLPSGLDKLSCLCVLTEFVVGEGCSVGELENLQALKSLRGSIRIRITKNLLGDMETSEGYLRNMKHLEVLAIELSEHGNHEIVLEKLEPPSSLKGLNLYAYNEATLPARWWGVGKDDNLATFLPNLVRVYLFVFSNLLRLPSFSKLLHLKSLYLYSMDKLEYIEDSSYNDSYREVFFPSLEELDISVMSELKGWWRRDDIHSYNGWQPSFSKLSVLKIRQCKKLTLFPACLSLEKLTLCDVNKELGIRSSDMDEVSIKLKEVSISDLDFLKSSPTEGLISICIDENNDIENLSELRETLKGCVSLRSLAIDNCKRLRSLKGAGWENLTALDSLRLRGIRNPTFLETKKDDYDDDDDSADDDDDDNDDATNDDADDDSADDATNDDDDATNDDDNDHDDDDNDGMPWRSIGGRLRSLELSFLHIVTIPQEMRHLTSLENLTIDNCWCLTALPEWISCLSSLRSLRINCCSDLQLDPVMFRNLTSLQLLEVRACPLVTERFQYPDREEFRHIPSVDIRADEIDY